MSNCSCHKISTSQDDSPCLSQTVRWGENYVSHALNLKFAGIIPTGIYKGFVIKPSGNMDISITHGKDDRSIAVVERDGYSLTVIMHNTGIIKIPTFGTWYICIEAFYSPTQQGEQRVVARSKIEPHHVVLGTVYVNENCDGLIKAEMISTENRTVPNLSLGSGVSQKVLDRLVSFEGFQAQLFTHIINLSTRLTIHELNSLPGANFSIINNTINLDNIDDLVVPEGAIMGLVGASSSKTEPFGAAITFVVE